MINEEDIVDVNDFLDQYGLSQCEADSLSYWLQKNNKKEIFKIFEYHRVNINKYEKYYEIFRKEMTRRFIIEEDNSFLESEEKFEQLNNKKFMFSVGMYPVRGMFFKNKIIGPNAEKFSIEEVKQIWIIKDIL